MDFRKNNKIFKEGVQVVEEVIWPSINSNTLMYLIEQPSYSEDPNYL